MNALPPHPLFRSEAMAAGQARVEGEIVLTQPVRTRIFALLLSTIMAILAAWIVLGQYTRSETARGILVTQQASAKLVALRPGQVSELLVREGDLVRPGQRLATIRIEQADEAGGSAVGEGLLSIEAQQRLTERQVSLARERAASERSRLAATVAGLRQRRVDLASQIDIQREVIASSQDMVDRIQTVVEKGFISRVEVDRRRQAWLAARQQLGSLEQQRNAIDGEEQRATAELGRIAADSGQEVNAALSASESLAQRRTQLQSERA